MTRRRDGIGGADEPGAKPILSQLLAYGESPACNEGADGGPVGYGNPPKSGQFKKGKPRPARGGRKRGSRNDKTILRQALDEMIVITEHGKERRMTKREALYLKAIALGLGGSLDAIFKLFRLIEATMGKEMSDERISVQWIPGDDGL